MAASTFKNKLTLEDVEFKGKRVLIRVDFNVPLKKKPETGKLKISDLGRVVETIPTLKYILSKNPRSLVIMSHLGRPDGKKNENMSLNYVVKDLSRLLGREVTFLKDCVGEETEKFCANPPEGSVILLENLRFHPEEEGRSIDANKKKVKASPEKVAAFRKSLTSLGDVYVNDAFGAAHRAHSSIVGIDLPIRAAGFLMDKELKAFGSIMNEPQRPFLAILGGAKVEDKLPLIMNLLDKVDEMIITGAMAFTFLKVMKKISIGASKFDEKGAELVNDIVEKAKKTGVKMHFPVDLRIADKFAYDAKVEDAEVDQGVKEGWMALDVGPKTRVESAKVIWKAKSILFNGPVGVFEFHTFAVGTIACIQAIAAATELNGATSIIGGGDTASAVRRARMEKLMTHVSTGGGAGLELMEGKILPGIKGLADKKAASKL